MACGGWGRCEALARRLFTRSRTAAVIAVLAVGACGSPYYTSDPIEAWVVDADTGKPIEGAIVAANWQLVASGLDTGGRKLRQLEVMETVTDKDGRFRFPGFTRINFSLDQLREEDPQILIFKPGYRYLRVVNRHREDKPSGSHRVANVNGNRLPLHQGAADIHRYASELDLITTNVSAVIYNDDPSKLAKLINALACERRRLVRLDGTVSMSVPGETAIRVQCDDEK